MTKRIPLSVCHRDAEVAELFVKDKIDRASSWAVMRVLMKQAASLGVAEPWERSALPANVLVMPLTYNEIRGMDPDDGSWRIYGPDHPNAGSRIIPVDFDVKRQLMFCMIIDRGSSGLGGTNFCMGPGRRLWCMRNGKHHEGSAGGPGAGGGLGPRYVVGGYPFEIYPRL